MPDHSDDSSKSSCSSNCSLSHMAPTVEYTFVSSAKIFTRFLIESGKSFIKTKNKAGPRTLLCGIPESTFDQDDSSPFITTFCFLSCKKLLIQFSTLPLIP